jgi:hypothetical protein
MDNQSKSISALVGITAGDNSLLRGKEDRKI